MNEWIFQTRRLGEMIDFCSEEEKNIYQLDVTTIDWKRYLLNYMWGLHRFILKENIEPPAEGNRSDVLLTSGKSTISNIAWAMNRGPAYKPKTAQEIRNIVIQSKKVNEVIKDIVVNKKSMNMGDQQFEEYLYRLAIKECEFIFSDYKLPWVKFFAFLVHSVSKKIYDKVVVDESAVMNLAQYDFKTHGPLIFMPTHRSYVDFMLVSYILFSFSIKVPQIVAAEDFLSMALIPLLLRGSGAFFIRRKKSEYPDLYNAILYEYIQSLLIDQNWLEFFIEGTRSRYGKTLAPKYGILSIILDAVLDNKIPDAQIIPITLNYDRILEGETFPYELLGEQKVKESLSRVLKGANVLAKNFGRVYVEIGQPISMKKYTEDFVEKQSGTKVDVLSTKVDRLGVTKSLGYEVVHQLNENLVVMATALVASVFLMYRKGISEENLYAKVDWLADQLRSRNVKLGTIEGRYSGIYTKSAVSLLENLISQKKDIFHINVASREEYKNIIMLSFYRNTMIHAIWNECIVACSLSSFGQEMAWKEGVPIDRLWDEVAFLNTITFKEFQLREQLTKESLPNILNKMVERGILQFVDNGEVKVKVII